MEAFGAAQYHLLKLFDDLLIDRAPVLVINQNHGPFSFLTVLIQLTQLEYTIPVNKCQQKNEQGKFL